MINDAGLDLIKSFEGFKAYPYKCPALIFTIGYGHTHGVTAFTSPVTEDEAQELLIGDIADAEQSVKKLARCVLNANQYAALVSLVFNVGPRPLTGTLGHYLSQSDFPNAADQFLVWDHVGGEMSAGLLRRRTAERQLFLTQTEETV